MPRNSQQQFKKGWAVVGGKKSYFRSGLERRWAEYLEWLKERGEICRWEYEPQRFEFEGVRSGTVFYLPDFWVGLPDGTQLWHEVKGAGLLKQKDVTKFRRMAKYYPDEKIVLVMQRINKSNILMVERAKQYVERVIEAEKLLKEKEKMEKLVKEMKKW